jgi:hypothetical protein
MPVELVADQDAVADDVPLLGGDTLVVVADRGQAVLDGAVAGDVHEGEPYCSVPSLSNVAKDVPA